MEDISKRKAFNFYKSHWEQIKMLNEKQQLSIFKAICQVQFLEVNINDIRFEDNLTMIVWTGVVHSLHTSIKGFISKQKGLKKEVIIPLSKGLYKEGVNTPTQAPCTEGEEKGEEKGKEEEEEQEQHVNVMSKKLFSDEIKNFTVSLFKYFSSSVIEKLKPSQKNKWFDTVDKLIRLDKYTKEEIEKAVKNATKDQFWKTNFYSLNKLRSKNEKQDCDHMTIFLNLNGSTVDVEINKETGLPFGVCPVPKNRL